jgi:hypothetical protein
MTAPVSVSPEEEKLVACGPELEPEISPEASSTGGS